MSSKGIIHEPDILAGAVVDLWEKIPDVPILSAKIEDDLVESDLPFDGLDEILPHLRTRLARDLPRNNPLANYGEIMRCGSPRPGDLDLEHVGLHATDHIRLGHAEI